MTFRNKCRVWLRASLNLVTLACFVLIAACWLIAALVIGVEHDKAVDDAFKRSDSLVQLFERDTTDIVERFDRTLLLLRKSFEDDPVHFDLRSWSERAGLVGDQTQQLTLIGADGFQSASTTDYRGPALYLGDREHFKAQLDPTVDKLFISKPLVGRASKKISLQFSRQLRGADGGFGGVIVISVSPSFIEQFYQTVDLRANGGSIVLRNLDGVILAASGISFEPIGRHVSPQPFLDAFARSRSGHYWGGGAIDGVNRLVAYRTSDKLPLVFALGLTEKDIFRNYERDRARYLTTAGIITLMILIAIVFTTHRQLRLERYQENLERLNQEISLQNLRFDAAIENMAVGLCMFDGQKRLVVWNDRYAELYRLTQELLKVGTPHEAIIADRISRGILKGETSGPAIETKIAELGRLPSDARSSRVDEFADGRLMLVTRQPMKDGGWVATHEDITERRRAEAEIAYLAHHDALTGLANRAVFIEKLHEAGKRCERQSGWFTVLLLDLDKFKAVNDTLGHIAGDQLLVEVARRLKSSVRESDVLARLGGDEFAVIQEGGPNQYEGAAALALKIIEAITRPFDLNGREAMVGTSIGIALAPEHGKAPGELLKSADLALYDAKANGRNIFRVFRAEMLEAIRSRKAAESELRDAIERDEFVLHYQPVVDVKTRRLCGVEALVRWRHPAKGFIPPDQFIPLAESTGLIVPLGEWILRRACADAVSWPADIRVAINVSAVQISKGNLHGVVLSALVETGLSPGRLELEITETALLENQEAHLATIRQLKNLGISLALDDFGTGYSSVNYLTNFPFDKIKIDQSFTRGVLHRRDCAAAVSAVLALAQGLDIVTTAEGVETEAQFEYMRNAGVNLVQGYLFGRPAPVAQLDLYHTNVSSEMVA